MTSPWAPDRPLGPIALAACLQIDAVCHGAAWQEQSLGIHYNSGSDLLDYVTPRRASHIRMAILGIPNGVGLGVDVDEAKVVEAAKKGTVGARPRGAIRMVRSRNGEPATMRFSM